jgi:carboxypeptidase D
VVASSDGSHEQHRRRFLTPNYPGDDDQRRQVQVPVPANPEDHRVVNLPLDDGSITTAHYAGLLPASSNGNKFLFYWLFYPDVSNYHGKEEDIPLLLWLNGGPGCSSMDGLFIEHGPIQLVMENNNWKITSRKDSWHKSPAYVV